MFNSVPTWAPFDSAAGGSQSGSGLPALDETLEGRVFCACTASLSDDELDSKIRRAGDKPINDGILADRARNIYQTDLENSAIGVTRPNGDYHILYQDDELLSWPDGFSDGPGGFIYVTANQLHRSPGVLGLEEMLGMPSGRAQAEPPYYLLRFKSLVPGRLGR